MFIRNYVPSGNIKPVIFFGIINKFNIFPVHLIVRKKYECVCCNMIPK